MTERVRLGIARKAGAMVLAAAAALLMARPASAHFVWIEEPEAGSVRVAFGEYPDLREGKELLSKVAKVKTYAFENGQKRELKSTEKPDHFLYADAANAPVIGSVIDYGVLQRENTPPFFLRYESVLLRGALTAEQVAEASKTKTGFPVELKLIPAEGGFSVKATLDGKSAAGELQYRRPGDAEMQKAALTDGATKLSLTSPGDYHLRLRADDPRPTTVDGKDVKSSRTYLSMMFRLVGAAVAAKATNVTPDADAVKILKDAHEARAHWASDFPGFSADAVLRFADKEVEGKITVSADYKIAYDFPDPEAEKAIKGSFVSLIMHRQDSGSGEYAATWKDSKEHALGRAINLNDNMGSWYRVRDRQILQVNRTAGPMMRFINNVLENESTKHGFLPRSWNIAYYAKDSDTLIRTGATSVTWTWAGEVFMPATMRIVNTTAMGTDTTELLLSNHKLLK